MMDSEWGYISKTLTMCKRDICKCSRIGWIGLYLEWLFLIMLKYKTKYWNTYDNQQENKC